MAVKDILRSEKMYTKEQYIKWINERFEEYGINKRVDENYSMSELASMLNNIEAIEDIVKRDFIKDNIVVVSDLISKKLKERFG